MSNKQQQLPRKPRPGASELADLARRWPNNSPGEPTAMAGRAADEFPAKFPMQGISFLVRAQNFPVYRAPGIARKRLICQRIFGRWAAFFGGENGDHGNFSLLAGNFPVRREAANPQPTGHPRR
jgi:hypothetical protein